MTWPGTTMPLDEGAKRLAELLNPSPRKKSCATRIGRMLGSLIGTATNIATGYVWATKGFWWGAALWAGTILVALAGYGAMKFPWRGGTP